jgi:hypothetical protein
MPKDFSEIARALRNETCPESVIENARRRIRAERNARRPAFYAPAAAMVLIAALACGIVFWRAEVNARRQALAAQRVQTIHQARAALALIGNVMTGAGANAGQTIVQRTLPPLREGLRDCKDKIKINRKKS